MDKTELHHVEHFLAACRTALKHVDSGSPPTEVLAQPVLAWSEKLPEMHAYIRGMLYGI